MKKVTVRLSDEMAERLEAILEKYELEDLEEALRFSARFTVKVLEKMETQKSIAR
ncbi:MAG: hypothetical protein QXU11_12445 [Thermoproteota archaeon]